MNRLFLFPAIVVLIVGIGFFSAACDCGSGEDGLEQPRFDDDDDVTVDDDSSDDDSADDDSGVDDDDDDDDTTPTGPTIEFLRPESNSTVYDRAVFIHGKYYYLDADDISICHRISETECTDQTGSFVFDEEGDMFTGTLSLAQGMHTIEAVGEYADKAQTAASVTFTVDAGGPYLDLTLSSYSITAGDSVTATARAYDANDIEVTDGVTIEYNITPSSGVTVDGNEITFAMGGQFKVTASCIYMGDFLSDYRMVFVENGEIETVEVLLSANTINAGDPLIAQAHIYDTNGTEIFEDVFFSISPPFGAEISDNNGLGQQVDITVTSAGLKEITGTVVGTSSSGTAALTVNAGDPYRLLLTLPQPVIELPDGDTVVVTPVIEVEDEFGNPLDDADTTLSIAPGGGATINQEAGTITFDENAGAGGTYLITAYVTASPQISDTSTLVVETDLNLDIVFTNPARGYATSSSSIDIDGYVTDCAPLSDVFKLNGQTVSLNAQCEFTKNVSLVTGLNIQSAVLEDSGGTPQAWGSTSILRGAWHADDAFISDAVAIGITEKGFAGFGSIINDLVDDLNIPELIMSLNPVFDERVEFWGMTVASARAEVTAVTLGDIEVTFDVASGSNRLDTVIRQNDIDLAFNVKGSVLGIGYSISGDVSTDYVTVGANTDLSIVGDRIYADVQSVNTTIAPLDIDINNFPDDLEDMFEDEITDLIEDEVSDALEAEIPDLINELFGQIPMAYTFPIDLPNASDVDVNVTLVPASIDTDNNGTTITFKMDSRVMLDYVSPVPPVLPGSLKTLSTVPASFGQYISGTSNEYEIAMYMGDDMMNQALYNLFRAGALSLDLDSVFNTSDPGWSILLPGDLLALYPSNEVNVKLRPLLPPVFIVNAKSKYEPIDSSLQLGDLIINAFVEDGSGNEALFLSIAVSASVGMEIDIPYPSNTLEITFTTTTAEADLIAEPIADFNQALLEALAPYLVEFLLPVLGDLLEGIEIPTYGGWGAEVLSLAPYGPGGDYISIWTNLVSP